MEIPASFYAVVGVLVVGQFATLITLLTFIFKAGMFVRETQLGVKEAKESAIRAHKRIEKIEDRLSECLN